MPMTPMTMTFVRDSLAACGVELPEAAQQAADVLAALHAEAARDVVADALAEASATPLTGKNASKRVRDLSAALTAKDHAAEAARHYERPVLDQFRQAIVDNIDDLIIAMRPLFDQAADVFHTAGEMIEPGTVVRAADGVEAVETYLALNIASQQMSQVRSARVRITELAGYTEPDVTWFIESADSVEALTLARALWRLSAHHLTRRGFRLRLNTRAEAEAVATRAAAGTNAAAAQAEQTRRAEAHDPLRAAAYAQALGQ
jgi:hypothetical protein